MRTPIAAAVALAAAFVLLFAQQAAATAVKEAPWRAEAAAYRATLFFLNLVPVPWDRIGEAWHQPYPGAATPAAAADAVGEAAGAIDDAIAARDAQATYAAANRALVAALAHHLDRARTALEGGDAGTHVATAREIWRAFADGVAAADPAAAREIGLAWLDLSSSAGSRGVLGAGSVDADAAKFNAAAETIVAYLSTNFAPKALTPRARFLPIPESHATADVRMRPFLPPGSYIGDQTPLPRLVLNFEEQGIDETDLPLIAYGDMLFDSAEIFGDPARSLGIACSTCHNRSDINRDFFIPGTAHRAGQIDVNRRARQVGQFALTEAVAHGAG